MMLSTVCSRLVHSQTPTPATPAPSTGLFGKTGKTGLTVFGAGLSAYLISQEVGAST